MDLLNDRTHSFYCMLAILCSLRKHIIEVYDDRSISLYY
jgi:hypothetical protein